MNSAPLSSDSFFVFPILAQAAEPVNRFGESLFIFVNFVENQLDFRSFPVRISVLVRLFAPGEQQALIDIDLMGHSNDRIAQDLPFRRIRAAAAAGQLPDPEDGVQDPAQLLTKVLIGCLNRIGLLLQLISS